MKSEPSLTVQKFAVFDGDNPTHMQFTTRSEAELYIEGEFHKNGKTRLSVKPVDGSGVSTDDNKLTVQDAIDQLMAIEDKSQALQLEIWAGNNWGIDFEKVEMTEYPESETTSFEKHVEIAVHLEPQSAHLHCTDSQVVIDLDEATIRAISYLKEPGTDQPLSAQVAIQTLVNDLGIANTRPGSWEGSNMQTVIDGHGWESHFGK